MAIWHGIAIACVIPSAAGAGGASGAGADDDDDSADDAEACADRAEDVS